MKKGLIGSLFLALWSLVGQAQGYKIEATLKGLKDTTSILGHYKYNNLQFIAKDTARADANGHLVFEGKENLPGGLYLVLLPGNKRWIELVYSGEESSFSFKTDTAAIVTSMVVEGSKENQLFYTYQQELKKIIGEIEALSIEKKLKSDNVSASLTDKKIAAAQQRFNEYRKQFLTENSGSFTAKLLQASMDPEIPPAPLLPNGRKDSLWTFNYYKAHYWDNFDFKDERLLRAPFLQPKLERYVRDLIVQVPDSVTREADALIRKAAGNKELQSQIIYFITSEYENPKVVGTEGVFVHMAEKYYLSGEMGVSGEALNRIRKRVNSMKPLLVNQVIPDLMLSNPEKKPISIHGIKANYTVLFFYSPTCGHCKEAAPRLKEFYDSNRSKGVKVLAIATEQSAEEWQKFIKEYQLGELYNGFDPTNRIDFNSQYDVFSTPTIYVLDKDKKILARRMPIEQLDDFFNFYLNSHPKGGQAN